MESAPASPASPASVTVRRRGSGAATLEDVARAAGVSLATASRALNGSARRVADQYRERVEAAADELGYSTNRAAQATVKGTTDMVALLVADIADPYFATIAAGVSRGAAGAGLLVTIAITDRDPVREREVLRALRGQRPRCVILAASRSRGGVHPETRRELESIGATGGTVVALGSGADGLRSIAVDNRRGAADLGVALARRGYRAAVLIGAEDGIVTSDDRLAGFTAGFESGGGHVERTIRGGFTRAAGADAMRTILVDGIESGTVVFGISDVVSLGAMSAIRRSGREIGADIAVAGFDDIASADEVTPGLTTVSVPLEEIGYRALRAALDDVPGSDDEEGTAMRVVMRDSTPPLSR